jgi:DUF4097 and DUF4098 domain-containing protein YvlB
MNRELRAIPAFPALFLVAALVLLPGPAASSDLCGADGDWSQTHFGDGRGKTATDLQEIHEAAPRGTWRIQGGDNGSVQISDWDKDEVLICAQVTAWSRDKDRAERLLRSIHVETGGGVLRAEGPDQSKAQRWAVSFRIFAPREINLNVETVNGGVSVEGLRGRMTFRSVNGPLQITNAGGDVRGRTTNGPISVALSGSRWTGEGLDLETVNGPVQLSIPERFSAALTTGTQNGPMDIAFPVTVQGRMRHQFSTVLGKGGPPIRVVTVNGPVVLQRAED